MVCVSSLVEMSQVYSCSPLWGGSDTRLINQKVNGLFSFYVLVLNNVWQCIIVFVCRVRSLCFFYLINQKVNGTLKKSMRALWMLFQDQLIFPFLCLPWRLSFASQGFVCPILLNYLKQVNFSLKYSKASTLWLIATFPMANKIYPINERPYFF